MGRSGGGGGGSRGGGSGGNRGGSSGNGGGYIGGGGIYIVGGSSSWGHGGSNNDSGGTKVIAAVFGVIGGLLFIGLILFCIRKKRCQTKQDLEGCGPLVATSHFGTHGRTSIGDAVEAVAPSNVHELAGPAAVPYPDIHTALAHPPAYSSSIMPAQGPTEAALIPMSMPVPETMAMPEPTYPTQIDPQVVGTPYPVPVLTSPATTTLAYPPPQDQYSSP